MSTSPVGNVGQLRLASIDDAAAIADIYRPIVASTPISFEVEPPGEQEIKRRTQETLTAHPWLVCECEGRVAGYAYATRHRVRAAYQWSVDTSVYVHSDFRRRGLGRALYTSLFAILAAQGYFNAFAGITLPNPGSVGLHESVGFQPVGVYRNAGFKLGMWHDVGWWQRALQTPAPAPRPPLKLNERSECKPDRAQPLIDEIQSDPSWQRMLDAGLSCIREDG